MTEPARTQEVVQPPPLCVCIDLPSLCTSWVDLSSSLFFSLSLAPSPPPLLPSLFGSASPTCRGVLPSNGFRFLFPHCSLRYPSSTSAFNQHFFDCYHPPDMSRINDIYIFFFFLSLHHRVCSTNSWSPKPATPNPKSSIWRWRATTTDIWPKSQLETPETVRILLCANLDRHEGDLASSEDAPDPTMS